MPITVTERFGSRRNSGGSVEFLYKAVGSDEEDDVRNAVLAVAPSSYTGLAQQGITDNEQQGNGLWFATVTYSNGANATQAETEEEEAVQTFDFDTTGGTAHMTQSLPSSGTRDSDQGTSIYPKTGAPLFRGAIGVDSEGTVAGVDVIAPVFEFNVTRTVPATSITAAYFNKLYRLTGKYNKTVPVTMTLQPGVTVTFPAGELLFKGCRGSGDGAKGTVTLTFSFAASENKINFPVGDITVTKKLGWQYLWVLYSKEKFENGGRTFTGPRPKAVYVEDVYETGNLMELAIA